LDLLLIPLKIDHPSSTTGSLYPIVNGNFPFTAAQALLAYELVFGVASVSFY
jgi:hypothetical protein